MPARGFLVCNRWSAMDLDSSAFLQQRRPHLLQGGTIQQLHPRQSLDGRPWSSLRHHELRRSPSWRHVVPAPCTSVRAFTVRASSCLCRLSSFLQPCALLGRHRCAHWRVNGAHTRLVRRRDQASGGPRRLRAVRDVLPPSQRADWPAPTAMRVASLLIDRGCGSSIVW